MKMSKRIEKITEEDMERIKEEEALWNETQEWEDFDTVSRNRDSLFESIIEEAKMAIEDERYPEHIGEIQRICRMLSDTFGTCEMDETWELD